MRRTKKGPLIIDQTGGAGLDDTWMVYPAPGFCFKFREVRVISLVVQSYT